MVNIVLRDVLFVPVYSFNSNSVSALWKGAGGSGGPVLEKI